MGLLFKFFPFVLSLFLATGIRGASGEKTNAVNIGAIFSSASAIGKVAELAIRLAVQDVNDNPQVLETTRLNLITQDTDCNGFLGIVQALKLMEKDVVAIVGPQSSGIAHVVSNVFGQLRIPLLSFAATDPTLTQMRYPYLIRTTQNDYFQMNAIADIVEYFGWREVCVIFVDDEYGRGGIAALGDALHNGLMKIPCKASLPPNADDSVITELLLKVNLTEPRVYVVHVNPDSGLRIFYLARELGMLGSGYVWIASDWLSAVLDSSNPVDPTLTNILQGVIALRHHTADSSSKRAFISRWDTMVRKRNAGSNLNAYGLYAYDSVWMVAYALHRFLKEGHTISFSQDLNLNGSTNSLIDLPALRGFDGGENLLQNLLLTDFRGLSGHLQFDWKRNLILPAYDIINYGNNNTSMMLVGYWSNDHGLSIDIPETLSGEPPNPLSSSHQLHNVIWPGNTTTKPRGWVFSNNAKPLRIGVPNRVSYKQFATSVPGPEKVAGFSIDVFKAALKLLPYPVPAFFIPIGDGITNPDYNEIVAMVGRNELDAVVGDISIVKDRLKSVDFTLPYAEAGLVIVTKEKHLHTGAWTFLKPFTLSMWLVTFSFFFIVGAVVWILEHRRNTQFRGSPRQQLVTIFWFSLSTMFFSQREQTVSTLGRFVLLIWLFVVLIITSSYTASLTSVLTVERLSTGIMGLDNLISSAQPVGYQFGSSTKDYLMDILNIPKSRLVPLVHTEDFVRLLDLGPNAGGVSAIVDELPYIESFLSTYCNYRIVSHAFTRRGWGFAFQKESPLVEDLSVAILGLAEKGDLQKIHNQWFMQKQCGSSSEDDGGNNSSQLNLKSFWGLFLVCGFVCFISLLIFFWRLYWQFRKFSSCRLEGGLQLDESVSHSSKSPMHLHSFKELMLFADKREEEVKKILKRSGKLEQDVPSSDSHMMSPA